MEIKKAEPLSAHLVPAWLVLANQTKCGLYVVKRMHMFLKRTCDAADAYVADVQKTLTTEKGKVDRLKQDGMMELVGALVGGVHVAIRETITNHTTFHNRVMERVVTPLQTFYKQAETMHKQLLADEAKVTASFMVTRDGVNKQRVECMKLWQHLTHGRQEKIASQTAFSQCQGKDPNVVKRLARATKKEEQIRQITHKSFLKFESMMDAGIKHQTTYYKTEMPGVMKDMEELEKRRLKEVERALQAYATLYQEQLLPAEQLSNKLATAIGHMNPGKDWEKWTDKAGVSNSNSNGNGNGATTNGIATTTNGVTNPAAVALAAITPAKLNYDLPCSADDIHSGIWVDAIKNFRVRNKAARAGADSSSPDNAPSALTTSSSSSSHQLNGGMISSTPLDKLVEGDNEDFDFDDPMSDNGDSDDDRNIESPFATKEARSAAVVGVAPWVDVKEKGSELLGRGWLQVRDVFKGGWIRRYFAFNQLHTALHMYTRPINPNYRSEDDEKPSGTIILDGASFKRFGWEDYGKTFCFGLMEKLRDGSIEEEKDHHWLDAPSATHGIWPAAERHGKAWIMTAETARQRDDWIRALVQYEGEEEEDERTNVTNTSTSVAVRPTAATVATATPTKAATSSSSSSSSTNIAAARIVTKTMHRTTRAMPWDLMACIDKIYYPVLRELFTDPFDLPLRICHNLHSSSFDKVARSLLMLSELAGRTLDLFESCIAREVELTASEGTLFRVDSVVTKMWVTFAGIEAQSYLSLMLRDGVRKCTYRAPSFEVNPRKLSATGMAQLKIRKQQILRANAGAGGGVAPLPGTSDARYRLSQNPTPLANLIDNLLDDSDEDENDPTRPKHAMAPRPGVAAPLPRDVSIDRIQRRDTSDRVQLASVINSSARIRTDTDVSLAPELDPTRGNRGLTEVIDDNHGMGLTPAYTLQGAAAHLRAILPVTRPVTRQNSGGLGISVPANNDGMQSRDDDSPNTTPVPTSHRSTPPPESMAPIGASRLPPAKPGSLTSPGGATAPSLITATSVTTAKVAAPVPVNATARHAASLPSVPGRATPPPTAATSPINNMNNNTPRGGVVAAAIAAANSSNTPTTPTTPTAPDRRPPPRPDAIGVVTATATTPTAASSSSSASTPTSSAKVGGVASPSSSSTIKAPTRVAPVVPLPANSTMSVDRASFGLASLPKNVPLTSLFSAPVSTTSPSAPPPSASSSGSGVVVSTSGIDNVPQQRLPSPSKSDPLHMFARDKKLTEEAIRRAGGVIEPIMEMGAVEEVRKRNELRERRREEMLRQESRRLAKEQREQAAGTGKKFTWETVVAPGHYPLERKEGRKTLIDLVWRKAEEAKRVEAAREAAAEAGRIEGLLEEEQVIQNAAALEHATAIVLDGIIRSLSYAPMRLRMICHYLQLAVVKRWPTAKHSAIGGFLFLRFICPSLLAIGDVSGEKEDANQRRGKRNLLLVMKLLQNLANGVKFGTKEAFMIPLNAFIDEHMPRVFAFCEQFANPPHDAATRCLAATVDDSSSSFHERAEGANEHLAILRNIMNTNDANRAAATSPQPSSSSSSSSSIGSSSAISSSSSSGASSTRAPIINSSTTSAAVPRPAEMKRAGTQVASSSPSSITTSNSSGVAPSPIPSVLPSKGTFTALSSSSSSNSKTTSTTTNVTPAPGVMTRATSLQKTAVLPSVTSSNTAAPPSTHLRQLSST